MAKTFEALMKVEKESQKRLMEVAAFESTPISSPLRLGKQTIPKEVTDEYKRLKYNILSLNSGKVIRAILFTSVTNGKGNSAITTNFAITLASDGEKVLLVDADLENPSLHELFNLDRKNGLTELCFDKNPLANVIQKTQFVNLSVITCGKPYSNSGSVLECSSLSADVETMKTQADWVLLHAPPIYWSNGAVILAKNVDGVVMVVEAEKTRWEVAASAKQRIEDGKGTILGVILNNRRFHIPGWIYKTL